MAWRPTAVVLALGVLLVGPFLPGAAVADGGDGTAVGTSAEARLDPLMVVDESGGGPPVPVSAAEDGIGPGTLLRLHLDNGTGYCTANFVWETAEGDLLLGTAGHGLLQPEGNATHGPFADHDASDLRVDARLDEDVLGGPILGDLRYRVGLPLVNESIAVDTRGIWVPLGEVVFAQQTGVGHDFGLVAIPEELAPAIRPSLPVWGGPTGSGTLEAGQPALHYGYGQGFSETLPTRARAGVGGGDDPDVYPAPPSPGVEPLWFQGLGGPGDSGAPVVAAAPGEEGSTGGQAVGLVTHGLTPTSGGGPIWGTTIEEAQLMVRCWTGLTIHVVPDGTPAEPCRRDCPEQASLSQTQALHPRKPPGLCPTPPSEGPALVIEKSTYIPLAGDVPLTWQHEVAQAAGLEGANLTLAIEVQRPTVSLALFASLVHEGEQIASQTWAPRDVHEELGPVNVHTESRVLEPGRYVAQFPPMELDPDVEAGDELALEVGLWSSSANPPGASVDFLLDSPEHPSHVQVDLAEGG